MNNLMIDETGKTPAISCANTTGVLEIKGKSIPENSIEFYRPVFEWIDEYGSTPVAHTELHVRLDYFNTSTSKCLLDLFRKLEGIHQAGKTSVKVLWHYDKEDEDMLEAGEGYQSLVKVPFELAPSA